MQNKQAFVIMGVPRTGSSLLGQLLGFHDKIACGWQWGAALPWWKKIKAAHYGLNGNFSYLDRKNQQYMSSLYTDDIDFIGYRALFRASSRWLHFPAFNPALWYDRLNGHLEWLKVNPEIFVIHISRVDNLAWLKSYEISRLTKNYIDKPNSSNLKLHFDIKQSIRRLRCKSYIDETISHLSGNQRYFHVTYEDLSHHMLATVHSVLNHLNCDTQSYVIDEHNLYRKQGSLDIADGISNYEEIVAALERVNLLSAEN